MSRIERFIRIPRYGFGRFIGGTPASIIPQATEDVGIVGVGGVSTMTGAAQRGPSGGE